MNGQNLNKITQFSLTKLAKKAYRLYRETAKTTKTDNFNHSPSKCYKNLKKNTKTLFNAFKRTITKLGKQYKNLMKKEFKLETCFQTATRDLTKSLG